MAEQDRVQEGEVKESQAKRSSISRGGSKSSFGSPILSIRERERGGSALVKHGTNVAERNVTVNVRDDAVHPHVREFCVRTTSGGSVHVCSLEGLREGSPIEVLRGQW